MQKFVKINSFPKQSNAAVQDSPHLWVCIAASKRASKRACAEASVAQRAQVGEAVVQGAEGEAGAHAEGATAVVLRSRGSARHHRRNHQLGAGSKLVCWCRTLLGKFKINP